jgi:hypothetical protein
MSNTYARLIPEDQVIIDAATGCVVGFRSRTSNGPDMLPGVQNNLDPLKYTAISTASGVFAASAMVGAQSVVLLSSGATALTTPTAAAVLAALAAIKALPNNGVGLQYVLRVINTNGGTLTLTMDASITATGTLTIATNTWRDFQVTLGTGTTATMQAIGTGTHS